MASGHVHLHDPQTLYRHWEEGQWNPWDVDLEVDCEHWQGKLGEEDKGLVHWALSSLMVAEERIATKFSGLVMAYETEEEESFLATQQVDEVRHMQFYKRFQDKVIADPQTIAAHVERAGRSSATTSARFSTGPWSAPTSALPPAQATPGPRSSSSPSTTW